MSKKKSNKGLSTIKDWKIAVEANQEDKYKRFRVVVTQLHHGKAVNVAATPEDIKSLVENNPLTDGDTQLFNKKYMDAVAQRDEKNQKLLQQLKAQKEAAAREKLLGAGSTATVAMSSSSYPSIPNPATTSTANTNRSIAESQRDTSDVSKKRKSVAESISVTKKGRLKPKQVESSVADAKEIVSAPAEQVKVVPISADTSSVVSSSSSISVPVDETKPSRVKTIARTVDHALHAPLGSGLPVAFPGADKMFAAERKGNKGIRTACRTALRRESIMPSQRVIDIYSRSRHSVDPNSKLREAHKNSYRSEYLHWAWMMQLNFNLLFYGFGAKSRLVSDFCRTVLDGEDVLAISGAKGLAGNGGRIIKSLLDTICLNILKLPSETIHFFSSLNVYCNFVTDCLNSHYGRTVSSGSEAFIAFSRAPENWRSLAESILQRSPDKQNYDFEGGEDSQCPSSDQREDSVKLSAIQSAYQPTSEHMVGVDIETRYRHASHSGTTLGHCLGGTSRAESEPDPSWGKRYAHAQSRLYIVINDMDGEGLELAETQTILAKLASCESISLIGVVNKINAQLLWTKQMLALLRWTYVHAATFDPYPLTVRLGQGTGTRGHGADQHGVEYILQSLTLRHRDVLQLLVAAALADSSKSAADPSGPDGTAAKDADFSTSADSFIVKPVQLTKFFEICFDKMIVRVLNELRQLLKELVDNRMVVVYTDDRKLEMINLTMRDDAIRRLLDMV